MGVLRKQDKDSSLVKIVPQLPGCDRLCPVRREVGKPPPALLDGHTLPQQKGRKFVKAASLGKCLPYRPAQLRLVRFKLGGLGRLSSSGAASPCPFQTWWAWSAVRRLLWRRSLYQGQAALSLPPSIPVPLSVPCCRLGGRFGKAPPGGTSP